MKFKKPSQKFKTPSSLLFKLEAEQQTPVEENKNSKFVPASADKTEALLKQDTIGLVNLNEFQKIKTEIESKLSETKNGALFQRKKTEASSLKRKLGADKTKLSFDDDETEIAQYNTKSKKDPSVDTSFLPDQEKEEQDRAMKERMRQEWLLAQEKLKNEKINMPIIFWNGVGHPYQIPCVIGETVEKFLESVRLQVKQIKTTATERLVFVKGDIIIPHHYSIYDFMINKMKSTGKPLFDASIKDAAILDRPIVCELTFYEQHTDEHPANRWSTFNALKHFE